MECKLTITGTFSEIQEALLALTDGARADYVEEFLNSVKIDLKREETKANGAKLDPDQVTKDNLLLPDPIVKEKNPPHDQVAKEKTPPPDQVAKGKTPPPDPSPEMGGETGLAVNERGQAHCHTCGKVFTQRQSGQKFCCEKCFQIEYREKNREKQRAYAKKWYQKKKATVHAKMVTPDAKTIEKKVDVDKLNQKLKEIRSTHPQPSERPVIHREY